MTLPADPEARLAALGAAIADGVARALPAWVGREVARIADAWGRLEPAARADLDARAAEVGAAVAVTVAADLRALFALPATEQRTTPLAVARTAVPAVTALLAAAGIPPVERDAYDEAAFPDDAYGLTPASLADLGDPDLGALQLGWGLAKVRALRPDATD